ncbi:MAG: NADH dehydrogenase [Candidatus Schekmanbacteria bacterium RIFCSPHIGHO2_02_FULL_38_11]|uniref:NADH dehydrogenase n=1 Tax=Candidatus Schekmanbacteria bacterium RIFCSPLOWO2_12_FULL_38_15 TaxID=1817883 RepID=A0A1F7SGD6_9BACT|nr:MAG: NADH dehydrogenase [Candidatus Schekmanbacteria bacterium RIFCSPLOWO2_02_FULL_38_14]OGL52711.1 MAG: NADH dehydrogenase [Candidatus Schekmanbacteria bacterium RIFCSPHIGHO2_02_FULL_38_11]OGL52863.1 MAG: NADH dehydrogenase [Candidatus Schekmanbacteria bacterium RIFCSPLOWO2_12_FULL_38_15]
MDLSYSEYLDNTYSYINQIGFPILTYITFIPLLGAIVLMFVPKKEETFIKYFANIVAVIDMVLSFFLLPYFNSDTYKMQFVERFTWFEVKSMNLEVLYFFGVDGISILLVLMTTILGVLAILSSWTAITERIKEYYIFLLLLQTGMIGVFFALDFFLFYVFWEVMLVPMYFLIGVWGGGRRLYSAIKFFLYTLFGSLFLLLGILALFFNHHSLNPNEYTFDLFKILQDSLPYSWEFWLFLAFFIGFAIKVPMFPFHTWLPDAHVDAPTAGSVILAGVLLKLGTYGFVRFSLPLFPEASRNFVPMVGVLSVIGIIYGAMVALAQKDMKKLVAYSSVSHLGFCMIGLFALNPQGILGSILQMVNHGISTGGLFLLVGLIYERRHDRTISEYGGIAEKMPVYSALTLIIFLSSMGLPGMNGFIGEFLILVGVFKSPYLGWVWAAVASIGIILGATYLLWMYQRVFFGKLWNPKNFNLRDLNFREVMTIVPLVVFVFWIGIYPKPFIKIMESSVEHLVERVNPEYKAQAKDLVMQKTNFVPTIVTQKLKIERGLQTPPQLGSGDPNLPVLTVTKETKDNRNKTQYTSFDKGTIPLSPPLLKGDLGGFSGRNSIPVRSN